MQKLLRYLLPAFLFVMGAGTGVVLVTVPEIVKLGTRTDITSVSVANASASNTRATNTRVANPGAITSDSKLVPQEGGAVFNGETNSVRIAGERFNLMPFTLAAWVWLEDDREPQVFINRGPRSHLFSLYLLESQIVLVADRAPDQTVAVKAPSPPLRKWVHLAGTYDGQRLTIYINGRAADSVAAPATPPTYAEAVRKLPLFIGAEAEGLNTMSGKMADVRIYNVALLEKQLQTVIDGGEPSEGQRVLRLTGVEMRQQMRTDPAKGRPLRYKANGSIPTADGFRGLWYANQPSNDEYKYKYSGGMATYPQQHTPIAIYRPEVQKTFFVYGGREEKENVLLHMISYFDHKTRKLARPRVLLNKRTSDAHDNPTLSIDKAGYLWVFSNSHGSENPSFIHRSTKPYDIAAFEHILTTNFSYGQPWYLGNQGFLFLHTRYQGGTRGLHSSTSESGRIWSQSRLLASFGAGHYQVSWPNRTKIGTAFNYHPKDAPGIPLNSRTNLYYMETPDGGQTWKNAQGQTLSLPLTKPNNPALALEFWSKKTLVYMKNLQYTAQGRPVILFLNSKGYGSGPQRTPRKLRTARWTGVRWEVRDVTTTDNNYDFASLSIEKDGTWRVIGTTDPGPQLYNSGGEVAMWVSKDRGKRWHKAMELTKRSSYNHSYPRLPLNVRPEFYALWADGHARQPSTSRLYFCNKAGQVFRMPEKIKGNFDLVDPERVH